ncbi:MAG: hypothetical protein PHG03_01250 [Bacilli bacterium]|nr:hypothetical protein [Bacilli bacterium]MDD4795172.1 hypothetical protein [Bacilli bacterium]
MNNLIVSAVDVGEFCTKASEILQFAGWVLTFFKVAIPVLIIALGMFDFGKAVVASEDDEIKKQTTRLVYRAIAGIVIFFIPTIVLWLFSVVGNYETAKEAAEFSVCQDCILTPWSSNCKSAVANSK